MAYLSQFAILSPRLFMDVIMNDNQQFCRFTCLLLFSLTMQASCSSTTTKFQWKKLAGIGNLLYATLPYTVFILPLTVYGTVYNRSNKTSLKHFPHLLEEFWQLFSE